MPTIVVLLTFIGRFLLGGYFLYAGVNNVRNFSNLTGVVERKGMPLPAVSLAIGITLQILGGLMVIFNVYTWLGALGLIGFTILSLYYFCDYWNKDGLERHLTSFLFRANLTVMGGLLYLIAKG